MATTTTRNAQNVIFWDDAEIYFSTDPEAVVNPDGTFGETWANIGYLNEGGDLGQERDTERIEAKGFGGRLLRTKQKFTKDTLTFVAAEDNETIHSLLWPNSPYVEDGSGVLRVPRDAEGIIARKLIDDAGRVVIDVSRAPASVYPNSLGQNDAGHQTREFTAEVRPDDLGGLYDRLVIQPGESTLEPLEVIRIGSQNTGQSAQSTQGTAPAIARPAAQDD